MRLPVCVPAHKTTSEKGFVLKYRIRSPCIVNHLSQAKQNLFDRVASLKKCIKSLERLSAFLKGRQIKPLLKKGPTLKGNICCPWLPVLVFSFNISYSVNYQLQSTFVISTSLISNNRLSRSENLVRGLTWKSNNR